MSETANLRQLMNQRLAKLGKVAELGVESYPHSVERTHQIAQVHEAFDALSEAGERLAIVGRVVGLRSHGKTLFWDIADGSGQIQIYARRDDLLHETFELAKLVDLGDFVGVAGPPFQTRTGEPTVRAVEMHMLAKAMRPLPQPKVTGADGGSPEVHQAVSDIELRYRKREVDLATNPSVRRAFEARSRIVAALRGALEERGFLEVETPILQAIYGGAAAEPFVTHHRTLHNDFYLRISPELYLKRLIVGGFERVYELGKQFRNEGMDRTHNPEFTMLEAYQAYADYRDMMDLIEALYREAALAATGSAQVVYQGRALDFGKPWRRLGMLEALREYADLDIAALDGDGVRSVGRERGIEMERDLSWGLAVETLFDAFAADRIVEPTFVTDHPKETTALCKTHRTDDRLIERFEPFVCSMEVGNAYTELNDPVLQRELLVAQERAAAVGGSPPDWDFIEAVEFGMPPMGGLGLGVDRMVMLLTDQPSIRDVILFPHLRPLERRLVEA
jgi:lysyl-tRNA synthetase class 2